MTEQGSSPPQTDLERRRFFWTVFQSAPIGLVVGTIDGQIVASNPVLQQMLGYSAAELATMTLGQISYPDDTIVNHAPFRDLRAGEGRHYQVRKRYQHKDGHVVWGRLTVSLIRDAAGAPQYAIGMVEDITQQIQAEESYRAAAAQLQQLQEQLIQATKLSAIGELAASVAHELKNPLTSVLGYIELLLQECAPDDPRRPDLELIASEALRTQGIVRNLLELSRQSQNHRLPTDVNELLKQPLALMRHHLERSGVGIVESYAAELPLVPLDATQIKQVVLNLLANAGQAMPSGGTLTVTTALVGDEVTVAISDAGVGISAENLGHIFEPFFSTKSDGTGLGLAISRGIVQEHGGRITVESREGQGSTFTVWLPSGEREWLQDVE